MFVTVKPSLVFLSKTTIIGFIFTITTLLYYTKLVLFIKNKHASLFCRGINDGVKTFYYIVTWRVPCLLASDVRIVSGNSWWTKKALEHFFFNFKWWLKSFAKGATTISIKTLIVTTFSITTISIKGFHVTLSIIILCHYAECRVLFTIMMNAVMLSVVMLSVVMLSIVMLNVVAPSQMPNTANLSGRVEIEPICQN